MASMTRSIRRNNEARVAKKRYGLPRGKYFAKKRRQLLEQYKVIVNKKSKKKAVKKAWQNVEQIKKGNLLDE